MERYLKLETIGRGSYAKVKKVKLASTGEIFAMKVAKKSLLKRRRQWSAAEGRYKNAFDDVLREVALMKKLNHPNVIRMHEVVDDPEKDKLCIVLDFHENGALMDTSGLPEELISPLSLQDARRFFADVVEGLTYLHFQNVVHFDLKPDNVLVSAERRGIIADFGVSRLLTDSDKSGEKEVKGDDVLTSGSPGTPMYLAPEVWGDAKYFGKKADVWSLGITLYVMVTGSTPFNVASHEELVETVCAKEPVALPPSLDPELRDLLGKLLDKDAKTRISLADVATHQWVEAAAPRPPHLMRRQYSRITVNAADIRAAVTIAGHANSFARDSAGRIVKRTRSAERSVYEAITSMGSALGNFVPPYHGELKNSEAVAALYPELKRQGGGASSSTTMQVPSPATSSASPMPFRSRQLSSASSGLGAPWSASPKAAPPLKTRDSASEYVSDGRDVCIVLDDVTVDMGEPCVMDIKMGTRTFTDSDIVDNTPRPDLLAKMDGLDKAAATPQERAAGAVTKLRYLKFREGLTTTARLGFRVDAMKIGDDPNLNDTPLNFRRGPREPAAVLRELTRFVCNNRTIAAAFAARLRALRSALETDAHFFPTHSLIRSSLLFTYDLKPPESAAGTAPRVGVHMIDFSSTAQAKDGERLTHRAPWQPGSGEEGYLVGVDNLIKMFDKVERGEAAWEDQEVAVS